MLAALYLSNARAEVIHSMPDASPGISSIFEPATWASFDKKPAAQISRRFFPVRRHYSKMRAMRSRDRCDDCRRIICFRYTRALYLRSQFLILQNFSLLMTFDRAAISRRQIYAQARDTAT